MLCTCLVFLAIHFQIDILQASKGAQNYLSISIVSPAFLQKELKLVFTNRRALTPKCLFGRAEQSLLCYQRHTMILISTSC